MDTWEWEQRVKISVSHFNTHQKASNRRATNNKINKMTQLVDINQPSSLPAQRWNDGYMNIVNYIYVLSPKYNEIRNQ